MRLTSIVCAILTFFMAALHLALLFGAPIGEYVLGGKEKAIPIKKRWLNICFYLK